jgi:hypothetical protein
MLFRIEASEITRPGLLRIEGNTLAEMRVSRSHIVASAEERLLNNRARTLESHTPNPAPTTVTSEADVTAEIDVPLPTPLWAGKNGKDALNFATALFSKVKAKLATFPSEGDWVHVNEVSLCH